MRIILGYRAWTDHSGRIFVRVWAWGDHSGKTILGGLGEAFWDDHSEVGQQGKSKKGAAAENDEKQKQ